MKTEPNFQIIELKPAGIQQFIDFWSKFYTDKDREKDKLEYTDQIKSKSLEEQDLRQLYKWKNGSILSKPKTNSVENKIISKLGEINDLKKSSTTSLDEVQKTFPELKAAIWLIFLAHIINKEAFPIFDMHVFRAYKYLTTDTIEEIPTSDKDKLRLYETEYRPFYKDNINGIKDNINGINYKKWDEAMWAFGKFLSSSRYGSIINADR